MSSPLVREKAVKRRSLHEAQIAIVAVIAGKAHDANAAAEVDRAAGRSAVGLHDLVSEVVLSGTADAETVDRIVRGGGAVAGALGKTAFVPSQCHGQ